MDTPVDQTTRRGGKKADRRQRRDRRRHPRFYITMSVQVRREGESAFLPMTLTDISLSGCYVETAGPFPVHTRVELELGASELRFEASAIVRVTYATLGMGLEFEGLTDEARERLQYLIGRLEQNKRPDQMAPKLESEDRPNATGGALAWLPSADAFSAELLLSEIVQFFDRKSVLTRDEFLVLLLRSKTKPEAPKSEPADTRA